MPVLITFATHSSSLDNELKIASGHSDVALSPIGIRQALEMGKRFEDAGFDAVFCSDLQRSFRSAELAFGDRVPIVRDVRLRECDYGTFTRCPTALVEMEKARRIREPFPGGESFEQTADRMRSFLEELLYNYEGKRVLIIGHRGTQYGLEYWTSSQTLEQVMALPWIWQAEWHYLLLADAVADATKKMQ